MSDSLNTLYTSEPAEEEGVDISLINRSILILHFNEEFFSWYSNVTGQHNNQDEILDSPHAYLIPPVETDEDVEMYLSENYLGIFEDLLREYIENESLIFEVLTEENFDKWIDYNFSTFVRDSATDYELDYELEQDSDG